MFTSKSHDHGADIIGKPPKGDEHVVVQCKHTGSSSIGVKGIDDLVRACDFYKTSKGILATNTKLSRVAKERLKELENQYGIKVWNYSALVKIGLNLKAVSKSRKEPREYQQEAIDAVLSTFNESINRALVVFATGLGKSIILAEVCAEFAENRELPVLVLADKLPLIEQLEASIWPQVGASVQTRLWDGLRKPRDFDGVTVASQLSVLSAINNGLELPKFGAVLVDECHHAAAPTYRQTLTSLDTDYLLGVTATPWRGDEQRVSDVFGDPVATMGIVEGIYKGFLSDVDYTMFLDNIDWNLVQKNTESKLTMKDLNARLFLPSRDEDMCKQVIEVWNDIERPPVITFCRSIDHANRLAELFTSMGLPSRAIHSRDMSQAEKALNLIQFKNGDYANLIGVDILNEGVDVPDVGMIVFARVTHSRRIFVQQLGRGLRVTDEKDKVNVLDFVADIKRAAEGIRLNNESEAMEKKTEIYRGDGAKIVKFNYRSETRFVEEYLADIADLEESDQVHLNFLPGS